MSARWVLARKARSNRTLLNDNTLPTRRTIAKKLYDHLDNPDYPEYRKLNIAKALKRH
jgi:hypothetical protein